MRKLLIAALLATLAGCATDDTPRFGAVTTGAGNAIAANTVMQMVDPWPAGVEETDLETPADLDQYRKAPAAGGSAGDDAGTAVN